ncbi:MAG: acyl carrier protein [bacterium]|nr:acyl carrier protein [bacterium]
MSENEKLIEAVTEIVADVAELEVEEVAPDAKLEDLGVDSLGGLRIVAAVEKKFGIVIDEAEIPKIRTMPDIFALVERHAPEAT